MTLPSPPAVTFVQYTIQQGRQYCDQNSYKSLQVNSLIFDVKFDSSAIYQTTNPANQNDINKLYGFSDNNTNHHQYSARFGWQWSNNALRLFAFVYNEGLMTSHELRAVPIGEVLHCRIKIEPDKYLFIINNDSSRMEMLSTTPLASGYQLYPYFGGEETAPHKISIWIKDIE